MIRESNPPPHLDLPQRLHLLIPQLRDAQLERQLVAQRGRVIRVGMQAMAGAGMTGAATHTGLETIGAAMIGAATIGSETTESTTIGSETMGAEMIGSEYTGSLYIGADTMGADIIGAHITGAVETTGITGVLQPPKQVPLPQLPHVLTGAGAAQLEQLEQLPAQPNSPHPPSFDLSFPNSPQPPPQLELPHPLQLDVLQPPPQLELPHPQLEVLQVAAPPTRAFSARNLLSKCPAAATSASIKRMVSHVMCRLNVRKSFDEFAMFMLPSQVVCPVALIQRTPC